MKLFAYLSLLVSFSALPVLADRIELTAENLYDHSEFWPRFVNVNERILDEEGKTLARPAFRGTLIRVEPDGTLLVDFGSGGILELDAEETNALEKAREVQTDPDSKDFANLVSLLVPRLLDPRKEFLEIYDFEDARDTDAFVILYLNPKATADEIAAIAEQIRPRTASFNEKRVIPVVLPTDLMLTRVVLGVLVHHKMLIPFVQEHLQVPYMKALHHEPESGVSTLVVTDADGKVLLGSVLEGDLDGVFGEVDKILGTKPKAIEEDSPTEDEPEAKSDLMVSGASAAR